MSGAVSGWILTYVVHSTLLIVGAWTMSRLFRHSPEARDVLWKTAVVGGIVTTTAMTVTSQPAAPLHVMGLRIATPSAGVSPAELESLLQLAGHRDPVPRSTQTGIGLLAGLWIVVAVAFLAGHAARARRLRHVVEGVGPASERARTALEELKRTRTAHASGGARLERAEVYSSDLLSSPCVVSSSMIVLPVRSESDLTDAELRAVLAHELAHVARRDVLWSELLQLVCSVLWFQPLNRFALGRIRGLAEVICDDWAVERTGDRYGLASSISRVAEWVAGGASTQPGVPMVDRPGGSLSGRVRRILSGQRPGREPSWLGAAAAALLVLSMYWAPVVRGPGTLTAAVFVERRIEIDLGADGETWTGLERVEIRGDATPDRVIVRRLGPG